MIKQLHDHMTKQSPEQTTTRILYPAMTKRQILFSLKFPSRPPSDSLINYEAQFVSASESDPGYNDDLRYRM